MGVQFQIQLGDELSHGANGERSRYRNSDGKRKNPTHLADEIVSANLRDKGTAIQGISASAIKSARSSVEKAFVKVLEEKKRREKN